MSETVTKQDTLSVADAKEYLGLYLGPADWDAAIKRLYMQVKKKYTPSEVSRAMRDIMSCAILLPKDEAIKVPTDPTKVLFWASSPSNLTMKNWFEALQNEMAYDKELRDNRHVVATLGVIARIDYSPITRQAFNWIWAKGQAMGHITDANRYEVERKFKNLVSIYGGQVICNLFEKDSRTNPVLDKVVNWRSGYFVERLIYDVYSLDSVMKIKKLELEKTNKDLIVQLTKTKESK